MPETKTVSIIVVDDEELQRRVLMAMIKTVDCKVVGVAENGVEALKLAADLKPDIILLDIKMPVMSGLETLIRLKEADPDAYVIMFTSMGDEETVEDCKIHGAKDFFRKDLPAKDIAGRLASHVERVQRTGPEKGPLVL
jgi:DNA-binding NarL/FixJ family response regulator